MFDHIRAADRLVLLLNTPLLMVGDDQRTAVFCAVAFAVTALMFNAIWQYAARHRP
jgi:hypothetical protein